MRRGLLLLGLILTVSDRTGYLYADLELPAVDCPKAGRQVTFEFRYRDRKPIQFRRWWVRGRGFQSEWSRSAARVRVWKPKAGTLRPDRDPNWNPPPSYFYDVDAGLWTVTVRAGAKVLATATYEVGARE